MNNKKYDIAKAFKEFVSLRSDTDTFHEIKMQDFEYKKLKEYDYFKENETLVGKYKVNNINDRAVVWAMKKGKSEKTIILLHHHDAVDTCDYLEHEDLSHSPKELREKYLDLKWPDDIKKDLDDDRWVWGRGTADMKSGMTINHSILYDAIHLENLDYDGNILLISVPDEENLSAGMRQVPCLLNELKEKHKIEYDLLILTEPHSRVCADDITIHKGSVGKITPTILAKGVRCHIGDIYSGINPNLIMAEVIRNLELNIEFSDSFEDEFTPPPSIIFNRDLKETYDVSTPEFSAAYFNVLYLNRNLDRMFFDLKEILQWSFEDAINKVNYSYNEYLRKMGKESYVNCLSFIPTVLTVEEFEKKYVVGNKEREDKIEKVRKDISKAVEKKEMNLQNATIEIMKTLASFLKRLSL